MNTLLKKFQVRHLYSTLYYPQTNGLVERFNRTFYKSLTKLTQGEKDWDDFITPVLFGYRTSKQASTKFTPFYLVYGHTPQILYMKMDKIMEGNMLDHLY